MRFDGLKRLFALFGFFFFSWRILGSFCQTEINTFVYVLCDDSLMQSYGNFDTSDLGVQ